MGIFSSAKDLFNGISPSSKKRYSPFFSAVLLYFQDFKILKAEDGGGEAIVNVLTDNSIIEILVKKKTQKRLMNYGLLFLTLLMMHHYWRLKIK